MRLVIFYFAIVMIPQVKSAKLSQKVSKSPNL